MDDLPERQRLILQVIEDAVQRAGLSAHGAGDRAEGRA